MRLRVLAPAALAVGLTLSGAAVAQPPPGPLLRPAFSPYLNLARNDLGPAVNYFGIIRPQAQAAAAIQNLQEQSNLPNPFTATYRAGEQPVVTGNPYGFQNYRLYFQNQFSAGGFGIGSPNLQTAQSRVALPAQQFGAPPPPARRR